MCNEKFKSNLLQNYCIVWAIFGKTSKSIVQKISKISRKCCFFKSGQNGY
ncbi:hypothetical protein T4D_4289 [Trichinella pseudospiralis]|uniref:Uncharacterized protein n=1 Tax=Trichinella pseudospiralis TaxID=6337 RepID=A0A0V1DJB9_TRIPS|nr:hypothetical protein T4D_4289 [Trichinella pseudospiralis]